MDRLAGKLVRRFREEPDEPSVVGLEGEDADQVFDALGSETSRAVLGACYEEGRTRSELADLLETSVQNVGYHVDKLESAGLLEAVETRYGENGREVTVYEPSKRALVIAAGEPGVVERIAAAVDRLFAPVAIVGLLALVAGVVVREPAGIGLLAGDEAGAADATTRSATVVSPAVTAAVTTFLLGLLAVLAADRLGAFDRDRARLSAERSGVAKRLLGRRPGVTRRYAASILAGTLAVFLVLDLVAVGTAYWLTLLSWLLVQWAIPAWLVAAVVVAVRNDGLLVSWGVASTPFVGIWGYLVAGDAVRGGVSQTLLALGPATVALVAMPLGSIAYLVGRYVARRRRDADPLSRRAVALLVAHPLAAVAILVVWFG
ncbi:ArsR/SmtB family transcription factor [Halopiger goleimassiliensis]|uniref:ArsR/SmtB family transcription factor n=1 Tax=Halopiger goleimassiliensis TaxID=1293048 RepID=UPI000677A959|nr:helix-turn-helix domain-containing protein [Halopiger goleimassiliensis]